MAADRFNINRSFEHIQSKYVGTGHADTTKFEWATNQHRDSIASYISHPGLISMFAAAESKSIGRMRYELLEKMLQPCGPPPPKEDDDEDDDEEEIGDVETETVAVKAKEEVVDVQ
eukprot:418807_1